MKKLFLVTAIVTLVISCQRETDEMLRPQDTTDSLVGRWNNIYQFIKFFSDSTYTTVIDSVYEGHNAPFSYLHFYSDSTYRTFFSTNLVPPIYGMGYSGRWRFDRTKRMLHISSVRWSRDTGWLDTGPVPPPNGMIPLECLDYLDSDSMVIYRQYKYNIPTVNYRRVYVVHKRKR
jgi:hypothetical protein